MGGGEGGWSDSLFMRSYQYEWSAEECDTTFFNEFYGSMSYVMHFPIDKILLKERAIFLLRVLAHRSFYPYSQQTWDVGLLLTNYFDIKYPFFSGSVDASDPTFDAGISVYDYGSDKEFITTSNSNGWIRPTGYQSTTGWQNENNARDTSTSTYSHYYKIGDTGTTDYDLILTYDSLIACNPSSQVIPFLESSKNIFLNDVPEVEASKPASDKIDN